MDSNGRVNCCFKKIAHYLKVISYIHSSRIGTVLLQVMVFNNNQQPQSLKKNILLNNSNGVY